jgi:hypothetical protein
MSYTVTTYTDEHQMLIEYTQYCETATRVEECHGYHTFYDIHEKNVINKIMLNVNGVEIDITDRLTDLEKEQITDNL